MRTTLTRTLAAALMAAVTLTSFDLKPAQAAAAKPSATPSAQSQAVTEDLSAQRYRRHRGYNNNAGAALAFGAIAGTIVGLAAENHRRKQWRRHHYGYYGNPNYGNPYYGPRYYRYR